MPEPNMIGAYGEWAAHICARRPRLAQSDARTRYRELLLQPESGGVPDAAVQHHIEFDGLAIEHLTWQLPFGPPTEAYVLKPAGAIGRLPAVLALHDHGGNKYFGTRKIARISKDPHPLMVAHQDRYYGGVAWANQLAKRGYVVLVADAFTFGSRRVRVADLPASITGGLAEQDPESPEEIARYNAFASGHEHIMAKSLFSAGTTWPGVFVAEDQRALDYLCSRPDVDAARVGCAGLSGGGLRTVYLTGADPRIKTSVCAGMMTTWRDFLLNKSYTHTWMVYIPGLPRIIDYPEIAGLNAPHPFLVLNNHEDQLFTVSEMQSADRILSEVYNRAGAADRYRMSFHPGSHKFDLAMQKEAFAWFDRWI
jgi:dienelactone hydrolase